MNKKYSYKDFTHQKFIDIDIGEFNNSEIKGSCFYQESSYDAGALGVNPKNPLIDVFPAGIIGVTFTRCNLDNCKIPVGATLGEGNSNRKIRVQNDNEDWILKGDNKPLEPMNKKSLIVEGKNVDPKNIPIEKVVK